MSLIQIPNIFTAGAVVVASQHNSNFSTIYSDYNGNIDNNNISGSAAIAYTKLNLTGNIVNSDISGSAAIVDTKLAQITTASKVSGTSITGLASLPAGAGTVPTANLGSGTANSTTILYGDQTYKTAPPTRNVLFAWSGDEDGIATTNEGDHGFLVNLTRGLCVRASYSSSGGSYVTSARHRWTKTAGVNTLTVHARARNVSSATGVSIKVDVGGSASGTGSVLSTSFTDMTPFTIDISGLSNGTVYTILVQMQNLAGSVQQMQMSSYSIEAS